jgi:hypothetical protein
METIDLDAIARTPLCRSAAASVRLSDAPNKTENVTLTTHERRLHRKFANATTLRPLVHSQEHDSIAGALAGCRTLERMALNRKAELRSFLRTLRARIAPEDVGLPVPARRRRTPGLRKDEAAAVAGVSLTWYSALEAGREIGLSEKTLRRIGDALQMTSEEREFLASLANPERNVVAADPIDPLLQAVVDGFSAGPAYVADRYWNVLAFNGLADAVYGFSCAHERNLIARMFLDPELRRLHADWERLARQMVAILHLSAGHALDDERVTLLVAGLRSKSPAFRTWDGYELRRFVPTQSILYHPTLGRLSLTFTSFVAAAIRPTDDPTVVVLQPASDEATRRALGGQ